MLNIRTRTQVSKLANDILSRVPASIAGTIDYWRPSLRDSWGGPLNGQRHRQEIFREIVRTIPIDVVVETGTFRGTTSEFLVHLTGKPLKTVEASPRFQHYAKRRLRAYPQVDSLLGDSRACLRQLATDERSTSEITLFYLDAHWEADLPLSSEIEIVASSWPRAVIVVDDFEVPGDSGYGYDNYGPGQILSEACLPESVRCNWEHLYPSLPASEETGARRGCIVLVAPALAGSLSKAQSLRTLVRT